MNKLQEIKRLLDDLDISTKEVNTSGKIGIAITTHNRYDIFKETYEQIKKYAPENSIIVVIDDASAVPVKEADFRFNINVGIAQAKNKCFELLYKEGCEHFFLFDDDTFPKIDDWYIPYVNSREPHLNYIFEDFSTGAKLNDTIELYRDNDIVAYSHVRGCMLYYKRVVLDTVGGMDTVFGRWGYEHPSLSDRIFMAGLTSFRYMDVVNSNQLIHSKDEDRTVTTTTANKTRQELIVKNSKLYEERRFTSDYMPFYEKENIIVTCYFTGVKDSQRNENWKADISALKPLINSLKNTKLIVFNDCFDEPNTEKVEFINVSTCLNPYFQRWVTYRNWMLQNKDKYENVFCVDATDVEVLKEPYWDDLGDYLWTGYEPNTVDCEWMRKYHPNQHIIKFIDNNKGKLLLNAGVVGGKLSVVGEFIRQMVDFYAFEKKEAHFNKKQDAGSTDMGTFNYIAYTNWQDKLKTGSQVCTVFKAEERNNYSWFKHK